MTIKKLEWDSGFFNLNIGKVELTETDEWDESVISQFDLVYVFAKPQDLRANQQATQHCGRAIDIKVVFIRPCTSHQNVTGNIVQFVPAYSHFKNDIIRIGLQSGVYSRFKTDSRLPAGSYERLYETWVNRSLAHEIADEVFIAVAKEQLQGLVTIKKREHSADIGIIAIDEKYRGEGIGSALIRITENYCLESGIAKLEVATQEDNTGACRFYLNNGFSVKEKIHIYHYWPDRI